MSKFTTVRDVRLAKNRADALEEARYLNSPAGRREQHNAAMQAFASTGPHIGLLMRKGRFVAYDSRTMEEFSS